MLSKRGMVAVLPHERNNTVRPFDVRPAFEMWWRWAALLCLAAPAWPDRLRDDECKALACDGDANASDGLSLVLCLRDLPAETLSRLPASCERAAWTKIGELAEGSAMRRAAAPHCASETALEPCESRGDEYLGCLLDSKADVRGSACRAFVQKLEWLAFGDFRLVAPFVKHCQANVESFSCGRLSKDRGAPFGQGETLACLQEHIEELDAACKREILHLSELQADDAKLDRQLYAACAEDRPRFCPDSSASFKCLMQHKSDRCNNFFTIFYLKSNS